MRAVVRPEIREAETLHTCAGELALRMNHINLLCKRHAGKSIFHTGFDILCLVEINGSAPSDFPKGERSVGVKIEEERGKNDKG